LKAFLLIILLISSITLTNFSNGLSSYDFDGILIPELFTISAQIKSELRTTLQSNDKKELRDILVEIEGLEAHLTDLLQKTPSPDKSTSITASRINNSAGALKSALLEANDLLNSYRNNKTKNEISKEKSTESTHIKNKLRELYQISKTSEKLTSILKKANDDEAKTLKKLAGDAKSTYSKSKNTDVKKLGDDIQKQVKDTDSDKKQISAIDANAKKITKQILAVAKENKITKADLDKTTNKLDEQFLSLQGMKIADLLEYDGKTLEQHVDEQDRKLFIDMLEAKNQLQNSKNPDVPPESILDDMEISGPDAAAPKDKPKEQKPDSKNQKPQSEQQSDAPPESILDDIETSGPDVGASKGKTDKFILKPDWERIVEEDMRITEQAIKQQLLDQIRDTMLQIDLQNQLKDLKQKIVIEDPKKAIIQKEPTKLPDSKIDNTKKPTQVQPKSNPIETKEKPIIQKDPIITEPKPSNTKPTLSIPKQVTQEATGPNGANVSFSTSSQDKEDGSLTPTCTPASGSVFPIGATAVSCTVTDSNGNSVSGTFTVTVRDTTPPAFSPFQPTEGVRDDTGVQVFFDVTANDLVDGNVPVICNYQSGYKFPPGVTELKCTASDSRGNQSTKTVQITVTVTESGQ
jgi:hypothetical protein